MAGTRHHRDRSTKSISAAPKRSHAHSARTHSAESANNSAAIIFGKLWWPVDIASLAFFRVAFGAIMVWEVFRYFGGDRVRRFYIEPKFFFSYFGSDWVQPWPGNGMHIHFIVLGVLALFVLAGLFYRASVSLFFLGFTYVFLLDQAQYLNHFYLVCLLSLLMIFVPAHRAFSLDARWRLTRRSDMAPAWSLWMLRIQIGLVYFFGGVAKLNSDWLQGEPLRAWLGARAGLPLIGPLLGEPWMVWAFAYGGLFFDLLIVPALLWRRTRVWAFGLAVLFHLTNAFVFRIGIFPWMMIAATTLFLTPEWPRRLFRRRQPATAPANAHALPSPFKQRAVFALLAIYFSIQALVPLRHFLYAGPVSWTEEGHRFSWRMKLRDKEGDARFYVTDAASGETLLVNPATYLNPSQLGEMTTRPDMILQFAHHLAAERRRGGWSNVQVRAVVKISLNGREPQLLVNPSVDLAAEPRSLRSASWIMPLTEPLKRQGTRRERGP